MAFPTRVGSDKTFDEPLSGLSRLRHKCCGQFCAANWRKRLILIPEALANALFGEVARYLKRARRQALQIQVDPGRYRLSDAGPADERQPVYGDQLMQHREHVVFENAQLEGRRVTAPSQIDGTADVVSECIEEVLEFAQFLDQGGWVSHRQSSCSACRVSSSHQTVITCFCHKTFNEWSFFDDRGHTAT
ncbi:hypothetical protein [Mesorhizobium sp. M0040]|uniref:hypothetical protein n=1 Tax=Mesorhizobium sp. M0040 TaxID=2956855 RepID=UPI0033362157